jgi:SMC interacting uncharacterized protein involved in chromosome segregation
MQHTPLRRELADLRDTMQSGFARMERYFELQQAQHLELRGEMQGLRGEMQELRGEVRELRRLLLALTARVDALELRLAAVESEVRSLRDWATREFAEIRGELRLLRREAADRDLVIRRDIDALDARVTRLEAGRDDSVA